MLHYVDPSPHKLHLFFRTKGADADAARPGFKTTVISGDLRLFFSPPPSSEAVLSEGSYATLQPGASAVAVEEALLGEDEEEKYRITVAWIRRSRHRGEEGI